MTTKTWIITGVSQGFGRELALSALRSGDAVVAAVRRPESVADIASEHPDRFSAVTFDVRDTAAAPSVVEYALERFGRIDVLVNNAGRGMVGAAEMVGRFDLAGSHGTAPDRTRRVGARRPPVDASAGQRGRSCR